MAVLPEAEIIERLAGLPGWEYRDRAISKQFRFTTFMDGIRFINRIAQYAEATDHHPDITINYRRVTLSYSTHSEGGLTEKDFAGAAMADTVARLP